MRSAAFGRPGEWALVLSLVLGAFCVPYTSWSHQNLAPFGFASITIVLVGIYAGFPRFPFDAPLAMRLGVRAPRRTWLAALSVGVAAFVAGSAAIAALTRDLDFRPFPVPMRVGFVFQAANEEIVVGFLLLAVARRWLGPVAAAVAVAAVFAVLHDGMYRFGTLQTPIAVPTSWALFAAGVVRNCLILGCGHIAFAWALHAAWNLEMFSGSWQVDGARLSEPELFDRLLGNAGVVAAATVAGLAAVLWLRRRPRAPA